MAMTILMIDFALIPICLVLLFALLVYYYVSWSRWRDGASVDEDRG